MSQPVVIKVGGALLESPDAPLEFFEQLSQLKNIQAILVHGGGAQVQALLGKLNLHSEKLNGMRVTPNDHMPIVAGVLAGTVNKQLVAYAQSKQCKAVGLSILDGYISQCEVSDEALGCVGTPVSVNPELVLQLIENDWLPVISSIGANKSGQLLNINADHAAAALASAMQCPLILLSDVAAVLDEHKQRIASLCEAEIQQLIKTNVIKDGMAVKVESALQTANSTGKSVTIASWQDNINLIIHGQLGTQITPSNGPSL
jgi:acetylglutamate kinase